MDEKILSLLGLARRAGNLDAGFDLCVERVRGGYAKLVLAAADISEKTFRNLEFEARRKAIPAVRLRSDMEALGKSCGIKAGVAVVTDEGFAGAVLNLISQRGSLKEECTE